MRRLLKLCFAIVLAGVGCSAYATTNLVSCDFLSISNALLNTAKEGDTVLIGPGDCVIPSEIHINRGISFTIAGSGTNRTTLRSGPGLRQALWVMNNSSNTFVIRDLDFVADAANSSGTIICGWAGADSPGFYHLYNIQMTNVAYRGISVGYGKTHSSYGLVDHCYMHSAPASNPQFMDFEGANYGSWTSSNPLGTTNAFYVEDCTFDNGTNYGNGFFDAYTGAQFVFRHNLCIGYSAAGGHGYDSGDVSPRTWEVYNNVFTNTPSSPNTTSILAFRGGTGLVFSNAAYNYNVWGGFLTIQLYRACPLDHNYGTSQTPSYLGEGVPGKNFVVNFSGVAQPAGQGITLNGQPIDGQQLILGFTSYFFVKSLANATYGMADKNGYGGGAVLIGATVAETITNLYRAVNVVPGYLGVSYGNYGGMAFTTGHEFLATGLDASNLYLRNALDGTNAFGYPANQQPGVVTSYPLNGPNFVNNAVVFPIYQWSNTYNGNPVALPAAYADSCGNYVTNLMKMGRDYVNGAPPVTVYQPLVYPHPLNSFSTRPAPVSVRFGTQ